MDISIQSLIFFIIATIIYFAIPVIGKPQLTIQILSDPAQLSGFYYKNLAGLAGYLGIVTFSQFFLNVGYLMAKCGGSLDQNIGAAALYTFLPWTLIFGVMLGILVMFPGFKSAFSDVIGYFVVSGKANDLFGSILLGNDVKSAIQQTTDPTKQAELSKAAEAIMKIYGNKSILINQMNPNNFLKVWDTLKPLMNDGVYENADLQTQLLNLVILKDNIGEALWYVYTAILISSIVYYNLATRGCVKSVEQIKKEHDEYVQQKETTTKQEEINNSTQYVIS